MPDCCSHGTGDSHNYFMAELINTHTHTNYSDDYCKVSTCIFSNFNRFIFISSDATNDGFL